MPSEATQWQPGQSGNPAGRPPKGYSLVEIMRQKLSQVDPKTGKEYREMIVNKMMKIAIRKGDTTAMKLLLQYVEGMPLQRTDITSGGKPINQLGGETLQKIEEQYARQHSEPAQPNP